jgi:hypothetical protein
MTEKSNPYGVELGSLWWEKDPRHPLVKKVVAFLPEYSPKGFGYVLLENIATGTRTKARLDRFNGRRGGYAKEG